MTDRNKPGVLRDLLSRPSFYVAALVACVVAWMAFVYASSWV